MNTNRLLDYLCHRLLTRGSLGLYVHSDDSVQAANVLGSGLV